MVAWSTSGRVEELTRDGEVVWAVQTDPEWIVSRLTWIPDLFALAR